MLGVIINCFTGDNVDDKIFDRYTGKTILEHTALSALEAEQAQKVLCLAPVSARGKIAGRGIFNPGLKTSLEGQRRSTLLHYTDVSDDMLAGLYYASLTYGLDKILVIDADKPLIPPWLINKMCEILHTSNSVVINNHSVDFKMWGCSFTQVASAQGKCENRKDPLGYLLAHYDIKTLLNSDKNDSYIPDPIISLTYSKGKESMFDYLLSEFYKGADVSDLVKDVNVKQQEDKEQP